MGGCKRYVPDPDRIPEDDWRWGLSEATWQSDYFDELDLCASCGEPPSAHVVDTGPAEASVVSAVHLSEHEIDAAGDGACDRVRVRDVPLSVVPVAERWSAVRPSIPVIRAPAHLLDNARYGPLREALSTAALRCSVQTSADVHEQSPHRLSVRSKRTSLKVLYRTGTSFSDVGLQIWRCSFLLTEYLAAFLPAHLVSGGVVLEIGAGVGLCGLAAAAAGARVWLTDSNFSVLANLRDTVEANGMSACAAVKHLDLLWDDLAGPKEAVARGAEGWQQSDAVESVELLIAADVIFNETVTTGFVAFLCRHFKQKNCASCCILATDKRVGQYLDRGQQHPLEFFRMKAEESSLAVVELDTEQVPHCIGYERTPELQLWMVSLM